MYDPRIGSVILSACVGSRGIVDRYGFDGCLPGNIQVDWTDTWCWLMQLAFNDSDLVIHRGRSREKGLAVFGRPALNGLHHMRNRASKDLCHYMFCYQTRSEMDALAAIDRIQMKP